MRGGNRFVFRLPVHQVAFHRRVQLALGGFAAADAR
jgi:hypothetical protein